MDNQNTKLMDVWFVEIPVLILVLMDNQNTFQGCIYALENGMS